MAAAKNTPTPAPRKTYEELIASARARGKIPPVEIPSDLIQQPPAPPPPPLGDAAPLIVWPSAVRGVPNAILRSALFGAIQRGARIYQDRVKKASVDGVTVIHSGPTLDQADLDVWQNCLHIARIEGTGTRIYFTASGFLKDIGRTASGADMEWLKSALTRLATSAVEVTDGRKAYFGPLLHHGMRDDVTGQYVIEINPAITAIFGGDGWTGVEYDTRRTLKGQPLAQWLHGFYASHARPYPFKVATLHQLCGSRNKLLRGFKRELLGALAKLAEATGWTCEIDGDDLVRVTKTPSLAQRRNLEKAGKPPRLKPKKLSTK